MSVNATTDLSVVPDPEPPKRGFVVTSPTGENFFAFPASFKITDPVLVKEISGLRWDSFIAAATGDLEWLSVHGEPDETLVMAGLLACAVWHARPDWPRDAVIRYVQAINAEDLDIIGVDLEESPTVPPPATQEGPTLAAETTTTGLTPGSPPASEPSPDLS